MPAFCKHRTGLSRRTARNHETAAAAIRQHFLSFLPLPHGHGSLRPTRGRRSEGAGVGPGPPVAPGIGRVRKYVPFASATGPAWARISAAWSCQSGVGSLPAAKNAAAELVMTSTSSGENASDFESGPVEPWAMGMPLVLHGARRSAPSKAPRDVAGLRAAAAALASARRTPGRGADGRRSTHRPVPSRGSPLDSPAPFLSRGVHRGETMSFLKRIFGKTTGRAPDADPAPARSSRPDPATDPNLIRVFDAYGRELFLTKEEWREKVLLGNLEEAKRDPDKLANLIIGALQDGFGQDVLPFAEHLHATDSTPARGATLLGVTYLDVGRPADAERVLRDYMERHGEDPYVLTNLAKAQDARGDHPLAEATLWRALQLDPNQENGLGWYAAIHRDRNGEAGWLDACRRVAGLSSSWRAQLWLARESLQRGDLTSALSLYEEALSHGGQPAPADLLKQLSGDLGNAGHLNEIVSLAAPHFDAARHGLEVGNNLIKANVDLGRLDEAKRIVEQLYAQGRPDWRQTLDFWDSEVAKARVAALPAERDTPLQMELLSIEGPLWLRDGSPCATLVAPKPADAPRVVFFGSTALLPAERRVPGVQLADGPGRLSRALPLVLAEQVHLSTAGAGAALVPWIGGKGFALFGKPYGDAELLALARKERVPPSLIGGLVLDATGTDWCVSLRLLRVADGSCLGTTDGRVNPADPAAAVEALVERMMALLAKADFGAAATPAWYRRPAAGQGSNYLLRLEQQLAVTCGNLEFLRGGRLSGEHEVVEGAIGLCVGEPANVTARLLLAQTLRQMKKGRPAVLEQYRKRVDLLQAEHPIAGEAGACISKALGEVFPAA